MKKISLIIFVLVSLKLSAQNQRFKKLSLNEGLSQSTVNCVIQDRLGFIWIGTQDGLNKYDGHKFKHYKNSVTDTNSIPDNFVQSLFEDSKGNIWIGTYGNGLAILNPKTNHIKRFNSKNSNLEDDIIMSIIEYENLIYIGTKRAGLYSYSDESKSIAKLRINKIENNIQIIDMELFNNALYICSSLKGIHKHENKKWNTILDSIRFQSLHSTKESIWYGSHSGKLFQSSLNNSIINEILIPELIGKEIRTINSDNFGDLWIGTFGDGLIQIDTSKQIIKNKYKTNIGNIHSLSHNVILSILNDNDGGIWIGTLGGGINYFNPSKEKFRHYNEQNGLRNNVVMCFLETEKGFYIGTYGGGLNYFDNKSNTINHIKSVDAEIIRCLFKDEDILWIGTYGSGILKYDLKTNVTTRVLENITDDVWCIEKMNNYLWLGTWGSGLIKYDYKNDSYTQFSKDSNSITDNTILSLKKDKNLNLWIGTYGGGLNVFDYKNSTFKSFGFEGKNDTQTNNKKIRTLNLIDNNLWIGTDGGGLNKLDISSNKFTYLTTKDGLPNSVIYGIIKDESENLWISTNYGLSNYNIKNNTFYNYDYDDGLQNNEFNQGALLAGNKNIYAGGIEGFNIFNLDNLKSDFQLHQTFITELKIMGEEYSKPTEYLENITINHTQNSISLEFSHLDFSGNKEYRCKLEGLDKEWTYLKNRNYINYTNLHPGDYILHYQGKRSGEWDENISKLIITIPPPFWQTKWFIIICILVIAFTLYSIQKLKERSLRIRNQELENDVKLRTQEIANQNLLLQEKNNDIIDSLNYAKNIQNTILPNTKELEESLKNYFIFYKPKEIVSGDFYWIHKYENYVMFAIADCTGHGVPGAFMSVIGINLLNEIVIEKDEKRPDKILFDLRKKLINALNQNEENNLQNDGMDIALCKWNLIDNTLEFSGAYNSIYKISHDKITQLKGDKQPIGKFINETKLFTLQTIKLNKGDKLYLSTDGYFDQFGGLKDKKFSSKRFKDLLLSNYKKPMSEQKSIIENKFNEWSKTSKIGQIDDICVLGIEI